MFADFADRARVIAHEAGHAVVAWASPSFPPVLAIRFYPAYEEAACEFPSFPKPNDTNGYLEFASVFMAGYAGERHRLGGFGHLVRGDLAWGLAVAKVVRLMGALPRARRKGPPTDFRKALPHGLHAGMKEFLNIAYDVAVRKIETHAEAYDRLHGRLAHGYAQGRVDFPAVEVSEWLGPRPG